VPAEQTRRIILDAAVACFNERGAASVTSRQISEAAGISNGNMTYHFPTMESLAKELFDKMLAEITEVVAMDPVALSLEKYARMISQSAEFQRRYRFFYTDPLGVIERFPDLGRRYRSTLEVRFTQGRLMIEALQSCGSIREDVSADQVQTLLLTIWMTLTFWPTQEVILTATGVDLGGRDLVQHVMGVLSPYLTTQGSREMKEILHAKDEERPS